MLWLRRCCGITGKSFPAYPGVVTFASAVVAYRVLVTCGIRVFLGSASLAASGHQLVEPFDYLGPVGGTFEELVDVGGVDGEGRGVDVHGVRVTERLGVTGG